MISTSQTLGERIAAGRLPLTEALRIGGLLADQLRQLHEQGRAHGALSPFTVAISDNSVEVLPAPEVAPITPYTAPELLQGAPADSRSDIFSFGAIVFEMLTGQPAFAGETPQALAAALTSAPLRSSGSPAVDRLLSGCVAKSPDSRYQKIQKLMLELRLLIAAVRRASLDGAPAFTPAPAAPATVVALPVVPAPLRHETAAAGEPAINQQMADLEARISARFQEQERSVASVAQIANEVLRTLRGQQPGGGMPAPAYARPYGAGPVEASPSGRLEHTVDLLHEKLSRLDMVVSSAVERLQRLEQNLDSFDIDAAALRDSVTRDIRNFERALKAQNTAIESARTAMGQTDDLVERVVEALDSMQSMLVAAPDQRTMAS